MKVCTRCKQDKEPIGFPAQARKKDGLSPWCRACHASWSVERRQRPDFRAKSLNYRYQQFYGLTYEQVVSMWEAQGQACAICGATDGLGKNNWPSVDHDHTTGQIRGLLCHDCNTFIGFAKDDPAILARAIVYLEESKNVQLEE